MAQAATITNVLAMNGVGLSAAESKTFPVSSIEKVETIASTVYKAGTAVTKVTLKKEATEVFPTTYETSTTQSAIATLLNA
jgi:hypothetical protein